MRQPCGHRQAATACGWQGNARYSTRLIAECLRRGSRHRVKVGALPSSRNNHRARITAANAPTSCAKINPGTLPGAIPANVSDSERAMVTAGLAKEVDAVNQ